MKQYLRESSITILKFIALVLIANTSCNTWHWFNRQSFYEGILPEKIEISKPILIADRSILQSCFFAVYRLTDKTVHRINQEGLVFFADATRGRDFYLKKNERDPYYSYYPWELLTTKSNKGSAFRYGRACADRLGFNKSIFEKLRLSRNLETFYTSGNGVELFLVPSQGLLFLGGRSK